MQTGRTFLDWLRDDTEAGFDEWRKGKLDQRPALNTKERIQCSGVLTLAIDCYVPLPKSRHEFKQPPQIIHEEKQKSKRELQQEKLEQLLCARFEFDDKTGLGEREPLLKRLPYVYSKYLSNALASRLDELTARPLREQLDMTGALALMQSHAIDAAQMYDTTLQTTDEQLRQFEKLDNGEANKRATIDMILQARLAAGLVMKEALESVVEMAQKIQQMTTDKRNTIAVQDIHLLVTQFVEVAYDTFGDENVARVKEYAEKLRQIKLPRDGHEGTMITPDMDVMEMDRSIPKAPIRIAG